MPQLADYALARLVGRAVGAARLHAEEHLGRREQGKAPAVAMSAAVAACICAGSVTVTDSGCVAKSYPRFWDDLGQLHGGAL